jgi:5'-3' exonuclease
MGITQVLVPFVEADDVIAWMAEKVDGCLIYSVDRDLIQLGSDKVGLNIGREFVESFKDKDNDVPCHRVALYKSLVGDSSDGYKGVKGFGPAKWAQLVETYGDDGLQQLEDMLNGAGFGLLQNLADSGSEPLLELISKDIIGWRLSWQLAKLAPWLVNKKVEIDKKQVFQTPKWSVAVPRTDRLNDLLIATGSQHLREVLAPYMPNPPFILDAAVLEDEAATLADAAQLFRSIAALHAPNESSLLL